MSKKVSLLYSLDWFTILLYLTLVLIGLFNIYAAVYDEESTNIFALTKEYGKQSLWILAALLIAIVILMTDISFFKNFALIIYFLIILSLVSVLIFGVEIKGARSWFALGSLRIQPAEFAKFATCLALAGVMSKSEFKIKNLLHLFLVGCIILLPVALIILQNDTGSALVYGSFIFLLYREGLHGAFLLLAFLSIVIFIFTLLYTPVIVSYFIVLAVLVIYYLYTRDNKGFFRLLIISPLIYAATILIKWIVVKTGEISLLDYFKETSINDITTFCISYALISVFCFFRILKTKIKNASMLILLSWFCIGTSVCVNFAFQKLQPHQQVRIKNLLGVDIDIYGAGYNVHQSKIAIGSGRLYGKGFLEGTQTKYNFVPEQSTDFIFCTIGEEWGFLGSCFVLGIFFTLLCRIIYLAERQRSQFSRIYGYGVFSIIFFHLFINVGMTIGLAPVMGIPLPFISYGGSSLWAFTTLLFIFLRLDAHRLQLFK